MILAVSLHVRELKTGAVIATDRNDISYFAETNPRHVGHTNEPRPIMSTRTK